jgi:hypothetical protein
MMEPRLDAKSVNKQEEQWWDPIATMVGPYCNNSRTLLQQQHQTRRLEGSNQYRVNQNLIGKNTACGVRALNLEEIRHRTILSYCSLKKKEKKNNDWTLLQQ